jgi:hypothetical protein
VLNRLAAIGGVLLRALFASIALVRRPRPIHVHGLVLEGDVTRIGDGTASGIEWIDRAPGPPERVIARLSRSIGMPSWSPDVIGLALRLDTGTAVADVELATTGVGVPGRFALIPRRSPSGATFSTLLPYRSARGPILLCARSPRDEPLPADLDGIDRALRARPWRLRLYVATPAGRWHPFADLALRPADAQDDRDLRFDAVRHPLPGAGSYGWVRSLRQPSYHRVQSVD